jgi:hypothetical protein
VKFAELGNSCDTHYPPTLRAKSLGICPWKMFRIDQSSVFNKSNIFVFKIKFEQFRRLESNIDFAIPISERSTKTRDNKSPAELTVFG